MRSLQPLYVPGLCHCSVALLLAVAATACSTSRNMSMEPVPALTFENATIDPVAVYVSYAGSQWLLGHVEPRRTARLRLPDYVMSKLPEVVLVAVPLATRRDGARGGEVPDAIRSELEPSQHLLTMHWTLAGHQLTSAMLPATRW